MLLSEKKLKEGYPGEKRVFQKERTFEEEYPDLLTYENEVYSWIDNKYAIDDLRGQGFGKVVKLLTMDELYPWVEEIVENTIQDGYNEEMPADDCFDKIVEEVQKILTQRAKHKEIQNKAEELHSESLKEITESVKVKSAIKFLKENGYLVENVDEKCQLKTYFLNR